MAEVRLWVLLVAGVVQAAEPGLRTKVGTSVQVPTGRVAQRVEVGGAQFSAGTGFWLEMTHRMSESFSLGLRYTHHWMSVSRSSRDQVSQGSWREVLALSTMVFNPDEDAKPMAMAGIGMSWLGWRYPGPFQPYPDEPDFLIDGDSRRAQCFVLGVGAEVDLGERVELLPSVHVRLLGWSDHTTQGVADENAEGDPLAPTTASVELSLGAAFRW